jgi:hypothetical protein
MTKIVSRTIAKDAPWPFEKQESTGNKGRFYRFINGEFVEVVPDYSPKEPVAPMIKFPTPMNDFHPVTGEYVSDSSHFRRINKECGVEERDMSPVAANVPEMKGISEDDYARDVAIAREQVMSGTAPLTDHDKHVCKQINERIKNRV